MAKFSKAARERIASRTMRDSKPVAKDFYSLSRVTLNDRPTAGRLFTLGALAEIRAAHARKMFVR